MSGHRHQQRTYRRFTTRLRFEPGQPIPQRGAAWYGKTLLGQTPVTVHLLEVKRTFEHPDEPGVTLMDAKISTSNL